MKNTKSAVLACVTSQYNCDRIIRIAKEIADSSDCELRVMSVLKPMSDYSSVSDEIEYLYLIAKESHNRHNHGFKGQYGLQHGFVQILFINFFDTNFLSLHQTYTNTILLTPKNRINLSS